VKEEKTTMRKKANKK